RCSPSASQGGSDNAERTTRDDRGRRLLSRKWELGVHRQIPFATRLLLPLRVQALSVWVCEGRQLLTSAISHWPLAISSAKAERLRIGSSIHPIEPHWDKATGTTSRILLGSRSFSLRINLFFFFS